MRNRQRGGRRGPGLRARFPNGEARKGRYRAGGKDDG